MQTLACYLYPILLECQVIVNESTTTRYPIVYANRIKLYKYANNQIKLLFKNNDQKSVDFAGYTVEFSIFKNRGSAVQTVATTIPPGPPVVTNAVLTINSVLDSLDPGLYNYSITANVNAVDVVVYNDDNYSVVGEVEVAAINPSTAVAAVLTPNLGITNYAAGNSTLHTFQIDFGSFVGTVRFQASLDLQPGTSNTWFDFSSDTISTTPTTSRLYNFVGAYSWVRVVVVTTSGTIGNILYLS